MIDHICSSVESQMSGGKRFIDVYHDVLKKFGHTSGLRTTQRQVRQTENETAKLLLKNYFTIAFRNLSKHRFYSLSTSQVCDWHCSLLDYYTFHFA